VSSSDQSQMGVALENQLENSNWWIREALLAIGLVAIILGSMWLSTGKFPPMVVIESTSMMHNEEGAIGVIDPGDLILVMDTERVEIVTFAEATDSENDNFGYESHGMPGDVIIFKKNGGTQTPVIHRAILKAISNESGGWDIPGTNQRNVDSVTLEVDYECSSYHGGKYFLRIENWEPSHEGFLTAGDNNGCMIDQPAANGQGGGSGLFADGQPVLAVKEEWIVGVASAEIPWIGAIKLLASGTHDKVTQSTWINLTSVIFVIVTLPLIFDYLSWSSSDEEE